jgi:hypothetical protein
MELFNTSARHYGDISDHASSALLVVLKVLVREPIEEIDVMFLGEAIERLKGYRGIPVQYRVVIPYGDRQIERDFEGYRYSSDPAHRALRDVIDSHSGARHLVSLHSLSYFQDILDLVFESLLQTGEEYILANPLLLGSMHADIERLREFLQALVDGGRGKLNQMLWREGGL